MSTLRTQLQSGVNFYPARNLILSVIAIFILFFYNSTYSQNGSPVEGVGNVIKAKEKLKEANVMLQKLIDDYRNDVIEEDSLVDGTISVHVLKLEAMDEFPDVWDQAFEYWYITLWDIDHRLFKAIERARASYYTEGEVVTELEAAERFKEELESNLKEVKSKSSTSEKDKRRIDIALKKLKELNEKLKKLIDDYKNDVIEEDDLVIGINELFKLKNAAISKFPIVWGKTFWTWYHRFYEMDEKLYVARNSAIGYGSEAAVLATLEEAKKWKEKLEKELSSVRDTPKEEKIGSLWTPPAGETRIAAVGTVRDEKVMMTSRGGSIGGTVTLETEEGEELTSVVPDEDGHFTIDFSDIAATVAVASTLVVTQLDSEGNTQASTTVDYIPGTSTEVIGIPIVTPPEVPYIENHQLNDLEGSNFGDGSEVVMIDEEGEPILQETVSSSNSLSEYFTDAPVGQAEVFVRNDFGNSEPVEIGVYEFGVTAGKMDLVRNEKTNITAVYEGLPEGTKIIFTNMSENVTVKPNGRGKASGNETIFTVKRSTGEVSMTLKARQAGGWTLNYRLEFPVSD